MRNRKQSGSVIRISNSWYLRYWEKRNVNGMVERKRISHLLGPVTTRGKNPPADVVREAERYMTTLSASRMPAERVMDMNNFWETVFCGWAGTNLRPSTRHGYRSIWINHLQPLCGASLVRDVRTPDAQQWMETIALSGIGRSMLRLSKSLGRVMFRVAEQKGYFEHPRNPFAGTSVKTNARESQPTHAYTLGEITSMLSVVPEPAATAIATAALAGLGEAELQGLQWEDYRDGHLFVERNNWNGHITAPKTNARRASVPVISQLATRLEMHRLRSGNPQSGPIFRTGKATPMFLSNLVDRVIKPAGVVWHGWHAFRRGLATNLNELGVPDKVIQRIMRHSNVSTTQKHYIKVTDAGASIAMETLENSLTDTFGTLAIDSRVVPAQVN